MALGQDKAVPVGVLRVVGIHVHDAEIEGGDGVNGREAAADVAGSGGMHRVKAQQARLCSQDGELFAVTFFHSDHSFSELLKVLNY